MRQSQSKESKRAVTEPESSSAIRARKVVWLSYSQEGSMAMTVPGKQCSCHRAMKVGVLSQSHESRVLSTSQESRSAITGPGK